MHNGASKKNNLAEQFLIQRFLGIDNFNFLDIHILFEKNG
jgi:hypothetical protein